MGGYRIGRRESDDEYARVFPARASHARTSPCPSGYSGPVGHTAAGYLSKAAAPTLLSDIAHIGVRGMWIFGAGRVNLASALLGPQ